MKSQNFSSSNLNLNNVILSKVKKNIAKKKSLESKILKNPKNYDDFNKLIDNLENPSFITNEKNNDQIMESNILEKYKLSFKSISKNEPDFEEIGMENFSKISGHSENQNSMLSFVKQLKKDNLIKTDNFKSQSNFSKEIVSKKSIFGNNVDNNLSKNRSFFEYMNDFDVMNNDLVKKSEIDINLHQEMDPDSSILVILEKEFLSKLETLDDSNKFNTRIIYDCLDFDSKIDFMKKFIINKREKLKENKKSIENTKETDKNIKINENIYDKNTKFNSVTNFNQNIKGENIKSEKNFEINNKIQNLNITKYHIIETEKSETPENIKKSKKKN